LAVWIAAFLIITPLHSAHAYIDAGTGSYAIQVTIGVIFGAGYALRSFGGRFVTKIKHYLRKNKD
jgi:hypothetical protein